MINAQPLLEWAQTASFPQLPNAMLYQIEGMAIGVREDFLKHAHNRFHGGRPFAGNLCPDPVSARVCFWSLAE